MAGAGIEVNLDAEYKRILAAFDELSRQDLRGVSQYLNEELWKISQEAFDKETDPTTGKAWERLKNPRSSSAKKPGTTRPILDDAGNLRGTIERATQNDGSALIGSNLSYARIHQEGGKTKAHKITARNVKALALPYKGQDGKGVFRHSVNHPGSDIPARPYMGVPADFDRRVLNDPELLKMLGLGGVL